MRSVRPGSLFRLYVIDNTSPAYQQTVVSEVCGVVRVSVKTYTTERVRVETSFATQRFACRDGCFHVSLTIDNIVLTWIGNKSGYYYLA